MSRIMHNTRMAVAAAAAAALAAGGLYAFAVAPVSAAPGDATTLRIEAVYPGDSSGSAGTCMSALATTPELKLALQSLKTSHQGILAQPRVRPTPDTSTPSPTPSSTPAPKKKSADKQKKKKERHRKRF